METKNIAAQEPMIGEGVGFERIRRITGYLVGTLDRFNNGKRAEEHDRVKHSVSSCCSMRQGAHRLMEGKIRIAGTVGGVHCGRPRLPLYAVCAGLSARLSGLPQPADARL